jgi:hypothetical protein
LDAAACPAVLPVIDFRAEQLRRSPAGKNESQSFRKTHLNLKLS